MSRKTDNFSKMMWYDSFIAQHPVIILLLTTFICSIITFYITIERDWPTFESPQLGFETRGCEISNRLTAWMHVCDETKFSGSLTKFPTEIHDLQRSKKKHKGKNGTTKMITTIIDEPLIKQREKRYSSFDQSNNANLNKFFCDRLSNGYSHLVISAKPLQSSLFSMETIQDLCRYQMTLEYDEEFSKYYNMRPGTNNKCPIWSLPNYIVAFTGLDNCTQITENELNKTQEILQKCLPYYNKNTKGKAHCLQGQDVYDFMEHIVDIDFLISNNTEKSSVLKYTSIYFPLPKQLDNGLLQIFHHIEGIKYESNTSDITSYDFGVKYYLFDEYLFQDANYLKYSTFFVFLCVWMYTGCLLITILAVGSIFFSLIIAYYIYTFILNIEFFPFMNLLAVIVSLGIGSDDAFIICKVWTSTIEQRPDILKGELVHLVVRHSTVAVFVTTLTTIAAFLSSLLSSVTAIRCFSIFAGLAVLIDFIFMITLILSGIIISSNWPRIPILHWKFSNEVKKDNESTSTIPISALEPSLSRAKSKFDDIIIYIVQKIPVVMILLFGGLSLLGMLAVLIWPRFQVPQSKEFQLFQKDHIYEKYDLADKNRFRVNNKFADERSFKYQSLVFVWGVLADDNGDYMNPKDRGVIQYDSTFDVGSKEAQKWFINFCKNLRKQQFYHNIGLETSNCMMEAFVNWMDRSCTDIISNVNYSPCCENSTFPYEREIFDKCFILSMESLFGAEDFLTSLVAGPRYNRRTTSKKEHNRIKAAVVEFRSTLPTGTSSYEVMNSFYESVESWLQSELKLAPIGMKNGWFVTYDYTGSSSLMFFDLQKTLVKDTTSSILISMWVAFLVLLVVTRNIPLSLFAILTVSSIIFVSISILILLGWKLSILESIAVSLAIGMSVDFSLHYAVNYKLSPDRINRSKSVDHALRMMAAPSLMSALTTGASGFFMLPSIVLPYIQIGVFLILVSFVSWIYATFFLMPLLLLFGPQKSTRSTAQSEIPHECHSMEVLQRTSITDTNDELCN